ncbi:bifunctional riboflavin kinase/FAD synthetase [Thermoanaerobacterium sp. DL9XJH110]|uniref:bifunctional riboflavin kinase/FAD synthetase n=1 Tax=Thermoanaerobacterium sp. DL9XJH110 TaxID=3386643 RepID=UPI003BB5C62C
MNIYRELSSLNISTPTACGLGNFDGVHLGHQKLIKELVKQSKIRNLQSTILTFEPHPSKILRSDKADPLLLNLKQKEKIIESFGIDNLVLVPFTREFSKMNYKDFIYDILIEKCRARVVLVGFDYRFGYKGEGTAHVLEDICRAEGIDTVVIPPVTYEGRIVSSTLIRSLISNGDVKKAGAFLGRPFGIQGTVVYGDAVGRKLGFPTANISFSPDIVLPASGVYAVLVEWQEKTFKGVANIGTKPTFGKNHVTLEVHLFNFNQKIYGETIEVFFIDRIRREVKFDSVSDLICQVKSDFVKAKNILDNLSS